MEVTCTASEPFGTNVAMCISSGTDQVIVWMRVRVRVRVTMWVQVSERIRVVSG